MFQNLSLSFSLAGALITGIIVSYIAIPLIVKLAREKGFVDTPNHRTSHSGSVPSLGGIAVFAGLIIGSVLFFPSGRLDEFRYIIVAIIIILFIGQKDDINGMSPYLKLSAQIVVSLGLILLADIRILSFHGFLGIFGIPYWLSIVVSLLLFLVITNAFNLIDGIDGLASGIGILTSFLLGCWLWGIDMSGYAVMAFALTGGLIPFFFFNVFGKKNKLFMGDTGSLIVGFTISILTITVCRTPLPEGHFLYMKAIPAVAIAILIFPLIDLLRVFSLRIVRGSSPFKPDRRHIHHILIDSGISHRRSTFYILVLNLVAIGWAFLLRNQSILFLGLSLIGGSIVLIEGFRFYTRKRSKSNP